MATAARRNRLADRLRNNLEISDSPKMGGLFAEEPVPLDVFLYDKAYMDQDKLLGEHQYDVVRHMEQVYYPSLYPEMVAEFGEYWNPVRYVNYLTVQWGKGAGKDFAVTMAVSRIAYLLLCLENPQNYFNLSRQSDIHILNVAMNAKQARRAFFKPLSQAISHSRWFADKLVSDISPMATAIQLNKQVELISGHSQVESFEGLSPIVAVLDEISGFQSEEHKASRGIVESNTTAEAVYDIVETSASTRYPENFKIAAISYPRYLHDPIQTLCAKAHESIETLGLENSNHYVDGPRSTWEVNPRFQQYEFITIPQTEFPIPNIRSYIEKYRTDAATARAKYECRPERATNRYMRNDSAIAAAFPKKPDHWVEPLTIFYHWGLDTEGHRAEGSYELAEVAGWQVEYQFSPELVPMEGAVYGIHVDLAVTEDRAGIAMCHVKNWERREHMRDESTEDYQEDDRPIIKVDFVTYYEADKQAQTDDGEIKPREIQLRWARNLVRELRRRGFPIGLVTFDTYQSVDSIQILEMWGIPAKNLSMDRNIQPYANLREIIYDGRLEGYYKESLVIELEGLNLLPSGKIDHPPGGSKDEADALCGATTNAIVLGGDEGEAPEIIDLSQGSGLTISTDWAGSDPFWQDISLSLTAEDLRFIR